MKSGEWTQDEIRLLHGMTSNEEIAEQTGRTVEAVRHKRYEITGYYVPYTERKNKSPLTPEEKEARIYALANTLGIKIGG